MSTIPNPLDAAQTALKLEFAALDVWKRSVQFKITRHEKLTEELKPLYDDLGADAETTEQVGDYELVIGARSMKKDWRSTREVYKAAGSLAKFLQVCTVTFKALSGSIGNDAAEALQVETQTGSRRIKAFAKIAPAIVPFVSPSVPALPIAA
jgi:hypothetical protein